MNPKILWSLLALSACATPVAPEADAELARDPGDVEFPGASWETGKPHQHGLTADGLDALNDVAADLASTCMLVVHDGVIVSEWYAPGYGPDSVHANLFSVTKSITSTVFGIAASEGLIDLDAPAADYVASWAGTDSATVTVRDLLSNDSGRHWSFESDYGFLLMGADQTGYALSLGQDVPPDTYWEYNNAAIQTLEHIFAQATGRDIEDYAQEKLFEPIGMDATFARDLAGNALVYQGIATTCRDIARFGHLALQGGRWKQHQVVPADWLAEATQPSQSLNDAYGYLWWLNREGHVIHPTFFARTELEGRMIPAASESVFAALGAFGQLVIVEPDDGYVVVRLQEVIDIEAAIATDPDPLGVTKLDQVATAFEAAKR